MKKTLFLICILGLCVSCNKIDYMHKQYIEDGPIKYVGKLDSAEAYPGLNRVLIQSLKPSDPEATRVKVRWEFEGVQDSVEREIGSLVDEKGKVSLPIDNLAEGDYTFFVTTYNTQGNSSVPVEINGSVYGERVQATIRAFPLRNASFENGRLTINWGTQSAATAQRSELTYQSTSGSEKKLIIAVGTVSTIIDDYQPEGTLKYLTLHLPRPNAVDTLSSPVTNLPYLMAIPKSGWIATASSFDNRAGASYRPPQNAIDGDPNTVWVNYVGGTAGVPAAVHPHTITVDMGTVHEDLGSFEIITRIPAGARSENVQFFTSVDGTNWTPRGATILANVATKQSVALIGSVAGRYFRMVTLSSWNAAGQSNGDINVALAEIGMTKLFNK
ncbi:MAG TPA: DUF4998 domain-containing protein [Sphingobacterium sp.]|nr:DUF4998 domain-containing protein [Sphingobacterium sp.]